MIHWYKLKGVRKWLAKNGGNRSKRKTKRRQKKDQTKAEDQTEAKERPNEGRESWYVPKEASLVSSAAVWAPSTMAFAHDAKSRWVSTRMIFCSIPCLIPTLRLNVACSWLNVACSWLKVACSWLNFACSWLNEWWDFNNGVSMRTNRVWTSG